MIVPTLFLIAATMAPTGSEPPEEYDCYQKTEAETVPEQGIEFRMTPSDIETARASFDEISNQPVLIIQLSDAANDRFMALQKGRVGEVFAFYLEDRLLSKPRLMEIIHGGSIQISGDFTMDELAEIQAQLSKDRSAP